MDKSMYNRTMEKRGFTLVEVLVATAIFVVVMLVAITALLASQRSAKQGQAIRSALDNIQFTLESITRSGRLGTQYTCIPSGATYVNISGGQDCATAPLSVTSGVGFAFALYDPILTTTDGYAFYLGTKTGGGGAIFRCVVRNGTSITFGSTGGCVAVTSPDIDVMAFTTVVEGADMSDGIQPSVKIIIEGKAIVSGVQTPFFIQTLVSQRQFE